MFTTSLNLLSHRWLTSLLNLPFLILKIFRYENTVMPSLHFLLAAAKDGDRDALLGLQTGHQGHNQQQMSQNQQHRDPLYDESRSNGNNLNNNLSNTGRQVINGTKNSPTDWLLSGGDTFRSTGPAADADLFSYQMPAKPNTGRVNSHGNEGAYLDDGRGMLASHKYLGWLQWHVWQGSDGDSFASSPFPCLFLFSPALFCYSCKTQLRICTSSTYSGDRISSRIMNFVKSWNLDPPFICIVFVVIRTRPPHSFVLFLHQSVSFPSYFLSFPYCIRSIH